MLKRLTEKFINATRDKATKRGIEWMFADFYNLMMVILIVIGVVCVTTFSGWALFIFFIIYAGLLVGWEAFAFATRTILLTLLYGNPDNTDENGDDKQLDDAMAQLDTAIRLLSDTMNGKED